MKFHLVGCLFAFVLLLYVGQSPVEAAGDGLMSLMPMLTDPRMLTLINGIMKVVDFFTYFYELFKDLFAKALDPQTVCTKVFGYFN